MGSRQIVREFSKKARLLEGSGYIATEKFLIRILPFLKTAKTLVDYGAGIGTISNFALEINDRIQIFAVETNEWCRTQYTRNMPPRLKKQVRLVETLTNLEDGSFPQSAIWVIDVEQNSDDVTNILRSKFSSIWVEGHRFNQRREILELASSNGIGLKYRSFLGGPNSPKGGCYFTETKFNRFRQTIMIFQELRIKIIVAFKFPILEWEIRTRIMKMAQSQKQA